MTAPTWRRTGLLAAAAAAVLHLGCGKTEKTQQPPPAAVIQPKQTPAIQKAVTSAAAPTVAPIDFSMKKDPFKAVVVAPKVPVPVKGAPSGIPILAYDVTQFRIIGIIAGLKENRAMVVDPAGKSYVLKEGMHIGKNNGKITRITNSHIEVTEQYREETGKIKTSVVRLTLPRKS